MIFTRVLRRRAAGGFTLVELLVVIAIMGLLASLTLMGFRHAQITAMRNRTTAFHRAIMSGLENYHSEFGEYPEPKNAQEKGEFGGKEYTIGGALMLYQAMSGDGDTNINIGSGSSLGPSDGKISDQELGHQMMKEMPTEMWKRDPAGYLLVDGFGHPFQYAVPPLTSKTRYGDTATKANNETVNNTYDLWSYAEDDKNTTAVTIDDRKSETLSAKWVKNW